MLLDFIFKRLLARYERQPRFSLITHFPFLIGIYLKVRFFLLKSQK